MFNIDEVFELAEQIERNGARFYRKAADSTDHVEGRQLLTDLAIMEDDHERTFGKIRQDIASGSWGELSYDPHGEAAQYLQSFVTGSVFGPGDNRLDMLSESTSLLEIVEIALQFEKETIAFFAGVKESMPAALGADKVTRIIQEEMGHVALLTRKREDLI